MIFIKHKQPKNYCHILTYLFSHSFFHKFIYATIFKVVALSILMLRSFPSTVDCTEGKGGSVMLLLTYYIHVSIYLKRFSYKENITDAIV